MKNPLHPWELAALWSLAIVLIIGSIYSAQLAIQGESTEHSQTIGIVIGGLLAALPMVINAMRNIGQAQAMQSMAEQLGNSQPVDAKPIIKSAVDAAKKVADAAHNEAEAIADESLDLTGAEARP